MDAWMSEEWDGQVGGDSGVGTIVGGCLPCMGVGATAQEVLTAPDCGAPEVTANVLKELGLASKADFAKKIGWPVADPKVCIALAMAGQYKQQGMALDAAVAKAKAEAPAELAKFMADTAPPASPSAPGKGGLPFGLTPVDLAYAALGVAAAIGLGYAVKVI